MHIHMFCVCVYTFTCVCFVLNYSCRVYVFRISLRECIMKHVYVVVHIGIPSSHTHTHTRSKVRSLAYSSHTRKLFSSGEDSKVFVWDLETERQETAEWGAGSTCEKCGIPFFWNVKEMWSQKRLGARQVCVCVCVSDAKLKSYHLQHHCRKCGRAVCKDCSEHETTYPPMGFEIPVRMCSDCHAEITTDE